MFKYLILRLGDTAKYIFFFKNLPKRIILKHNVYLIYRLNASKLYCLYFIIIYD